MSSTETATQRLKQPEVNRGGSTQAGCTPWLIISCVVLAATTAFVFGWGLGAPNMYNHYTEPFLKGHDPCTANQQALANKSLPPPVMDARNTADGSYAENAEVQRNENGEAIAAEPTTTPKPLKEPFNFVLELVKGIPQTIFLIGAFIGAITGPFWGKYFDRKRTVFANYIFCFASSLCVLLAYYFKQPWLFYLSRLLLGYQGGMACAVVPPYLGEISSQRVRGSAGVAFQLGLTLGILFAQLIGSPRIAGTCTGWGWGLSIVFLLPLAGIFLLLLIPNSPTQMIGTYNNVDQAREDLIKLRKMPNVDADIQDIEEQTRQTTGSKAKSLSIPQVLTSTHYRWPMLTTVVLQFAQALSGVNAIFFYSSKMFAKAGIKPEYIPYANIGTGLINVITTIVAVFLIDKLGRKKLIIWPMGVMVVVFALLTALVQVNESRNSATLGLLSVILILLFVVCFAVGLGPIPYLYGTEVCRPEARDAVQSIGLIANYVGNILLSLFFPALNSALGGYVFLIFVVVISLNIAFLSVKMFETKNRTVEDAERFWKITPTPAKDTELKEQFIQPTTTSVRT